MNSINIEEPFGVEARLRFTLCIVNVSGEYEPGYVPPHVNIGFVVGVGDGVTGGGNVSVGVGVTSGVGV
jgi:hypothetical protein